MMKMNSRLVFLSVTYNKAYWTLGRAPLREATGLFQHNRKNYDATCTVSGALQKLGLGKVLENLFRFFKLFIRKIVINELLC